MWSFLQGCSGRWAGTQGFLVGSYVAVACSCGGLSATAPVHSECFAGPARAGRPSPPAGPACWLDLLLPPASTSCHITPAPCQPIANPTARQVWELDKKLLQVHALPLVLGYTLELATALKGLDMDESLPQELLPGALLLAGGVHSCLSSRSVVEWSVQTRKHTAGRVGSKPGSCVASLFWCSHPLHVRCVSRRRRRPGRPPRGQDLPARAQDASVRQLSAAAAHQDGGAEPSDL